MDNTGDLGLLLASRHPLIVAAMQDEKRFLDIVSRAAAAQQLQVWTWSSTRGLGLLGLEPIYGTIEPAKALQAIGASSKSGVFVFLDLHEALQDAGLVRALKDAALSGRKGQTIVVTGPRLTVPPEWQGLAVRWKLQPPGTAELEALVNRSMKDLRDRGFPVAIDAAEMRRLTEALQGLSVTEAEHVIQQAAVRDGALGGDDIAFVRARKAGLLQASGALELIEADLGTLGDVGGLDGLKRWLSVRGRAFEAGASDFGLEPPRGVLITGVPGCGKSLLAKTLARSWDMPLVLLDAAGMYGPYVGESEARLDEALATVDAMAPVVVWVDEIEKGFASGGNDGGVSKRLLGSFLRWMQDRRPGVFVVATANDVSALPPEFLRKGRFDEVFFVDLPTPAERSQIFELQLRRRDRDPSAFDISALRDASDGFSGAEIEAAVVGAMYHAYGDGAELGTAHVLEELAATVPLSRTRAEDLQRLREWARSRAVPASGAPGGAADGPEPASGPLRMMTA